MKTWGKSGIIWEEFIEWRNVCEIDEEKKGSDEEVSGWTWEALGRMWLEARIWADSGMLERNNK